MICAMSPILQMMPNMTEKWCPNGSQNRSKIIQKSIRKPMHNFNASWHRFLIDFGQVWTPRRASKSTPNRSNYDFGRPWRPQGCPRRPQEPPKTFPRAQIDTKIDPKSIPNRSQIGPTSMQTLRVKAFLNLCFSRVKGQGSRAKGQGPIVKD